MQQLVAFPPTLVPAFRQLESLGAHFYAWEKPMLFFGVDIYACKPFDAVAITRFTREHLDALEVVARAF